MIRRAIKVCVLAALLLGPAVGAERMALAQSGAPSPKSIAGKWEIFLPEKRASSARGVELTAKGAALAGTYQNREGKKLAMRPLKLSGKTLTFTVPGAGLEVSLDYGKKGAADYFEGSVLKGMPPVNG